MSTKKKIQLAIDIAQGMNYLHMQDPPIIHRDLKAANILIGEGSMAKICDFG